MQLHRPRWTGTKGKVTTFLEESSLWTKPGLIYMNQTWNVKQMNGSIPVPIVQGKCTLHNVLWRWCSFGLWHWWGITALHLPPRQTVNAACYCTVPAAPPSFSAQDKTTTLSGTETHRHSSWHCKESHCCCWQWVILEHWLYSPDMSPCNYDLITKVKEPLRGTRYNMRWNYTCFRAVNTEHQKDGCADGVQCLPNIWKKVINKEGGFIEGT